MGRENEIWNTKSNKGQLNYSDIKPQTNMIEWIFEANQDHLPILNTILHLRAQTIHIPADINPKTDDMTCKLCNNHTCDLNHLTHICEKTEENRVQLTSAINQLLKKNLNTKEINNINTEIINIINLTTTAKLKLNMTILQAYSIFIQSIEYPKNKKPY